MAYVSHLFYTPQLSVSKASAFGVLFYISVPHGSIHNLWQVVEAILTIPPLAVLWMVGLFSIVITLWNSLLKEGCPPPSFKHAPAMLLFHIYD